MFDPTLLEPIPVLTEWHVHTGSVYLFIVGPGPDAWLRCSRRSNTPGTPEERELAARAVAILATRHGQSKDAGQSEILAALIECGYEEEEP